MASSSPFSGFGDGGGGRSGGGRGGGFGGRGGGGGDGQQRRRPLQDDEEYAPRRKVHGQRPVDFYSPAIQHVLTRLLPKLTPYSYHVAPHEYYTKDLLPARETAFNPTTALCTQWVNTSFHPDARDSRMRIAIFGMQWAPNGRRLLCTTNRGEFLLFNGQSFGVEVKTVAHEDNRACRALAWGPRSDLILSGDDGGSMKLWMSNFVFLAEFDSSHRVVREVSWAPTEHKFVTVGQDGTGRVWDLNAVGTNANATGGGDGAGREEAKLEGHGGDVTSVDWHPYRSLIATGSQDTTCRLWDPRTAASSGSVAALHGHGQDVSCVRWHPDGRTLLSASKDGAIKLWDIRKAQPELIRFHGHVDGVEKVAWHPSVPDLFASTGTDGKIIYWMVNECAGTPVHGVLESIKDAATVEAAHDKFHDKANPVFNLAWSPLGNILSSCGTEVKYWTRNKPGALEEKQLGGGDADILDGDGRL